MHAELLKSVENLSGKPSTTDATSQPSSSNACVNELPQNTEQNPDSEAGIVADNVSRSSKKGKTVTIRPPDGHATLNEDRYCSRRNSGVRLNRHGKHPLTGANGATSKDRTSNSPATVDVNNNEDGESNKDSNEDEYGGTRVYALRYAILVMFVILSASNAMQWIEYSIIAEIITKYYGVEFWQVDWTSMIYMLTYMLLVFPGSWFLDRFGLRWSVLIGAFGNCVGAWLKILSVSPDRFWLTFIAQTIVGASQVFILGIPPRLAAVWFGTRQVSTACAVGVFGNQLGIAIGFILPPYLVRKGMSDEIGNGLRTLFFISAIVNTIILICLTLFFRERPPTPPSLAQARAIEESVDHEFCLSLKKLVLNRNYMILLLSYGINVGVFYAVSTLLSQMVLYYHKDAEEKVGTIGLLIVVSGMVGSVVCGYALDRFHLYKSTTILVYFFSFLGMVLFTFSVSDGAELWTIFVVAALLGFFMTGYLPLGFEFAAELTFPIAEGTTSGFLNAAVQAFGVAMTIGMGRVINLLSIPWANSIMSGFLLVGLGLTALIKADLRRQNAHNNVHYTRPNTEVATREP